jgi:uridine kinase
VFLNRQELAGLWNYSIFVEVPVEESTVEAQADALYIAEARPRSAAVAIIDNRDQDHPRRVFADSC